MQNTQEGVPHVIYYTIAIGVISWTIFIYFHDEVVRIILLLKLFEIHVISLGTNQLNYLIDWIHNTPVEAVSAHSLYAISTIVGNFIRWCVIPISIVAIGLLWKFHPENKLSTIYSMKSLLQSMKNEFPETRPIIDKSLDAKAINQGSWRMAMTPVEFMKEYKLLIDRKTIDKELAKNIFIKQLGVVWTSDKNLSQDEKSVFGILAALVCYNRSEAQRAANEISVSSQYSQLKCNAALKLLDQYIEDKKIQKIISSHHYVYTIFSSLLEEARKSGIVSTTMFLWLKSRNRSLWYCLNNVGRKAVFVEAAAIHSHWLAEKSVGSAIIMPVVDQAVDGLEAVFSTVEIE